MIFVPFTSTDVLVFLQTAFSVNLSSLEDYQVCILTLITNAYFFGFWFFILYFTLKSLNWVYERLF